MILSFGQFLVGQNLITEEQHKIALQIQNKNRLLGEIAIEMSYLEKGDIDLIQEYMNTHQNVQFGEAAVSLGLINVNQLRYLLDIRTRRKVPIGDILVKKAYISQDELNKALMQFEQRKRKLKNVLIAESSPTISRALENMLTKYGYTIMQAKTGEEAFGLALEKKPDLIIAAGLLPDMEGYEFCYRIITHTETAGISLIFLSGDDGREIVEKAFEVGVNHFLKKPVSEKELINVIYLLEREMSEKRPEKILVVDDSKGARMVIFKELTKAGYHVYLAENGKEGVEKAKLLKPDIITMDLEMPVVDGFEACRVLKEDPETGDIPVIIISSRTLSKIQERGFESGAVEYFTKPFKPGRLAAYVNVLLETRKIKKAEKVMVVDDNSVMRHILKYIFGKNGYAVVTVDSAETALQTALDTKPDLIITDCYMPKIDGFEFTRRLKKDEALRHIPVIMVTGSNNRDDILKGLAAGATDYITKPFDEAELLARAGLHLLNKKLFDELREERDKLEKMKNEISRYALKMETLARTDYLTGAINRRYFYELCEKEFYRCQRYDKPLSMLAVDIDHFKRINDQFGHAAGDMVLVAIVKICQATLRESDIFGRLGGEEFSAALVETDIDRAMQVAERVRHNIVAQKIEAGDAFIRVSVSVGVTMLREEDDSLEELLNRADEALYIAKNAGRNRVTMI